MLKTARAIGLTWPMIFGVIGLYFVGTIFEGIGLTILLPVFHLMQSGETATQLASTSRWWSYLVNFYAFLGMTVTVPILLVTSFMAILARQVLVYFRLIYTAYVKFAVVRRIAIESFAHFCERNSAMERRKVWDVSLMT